MKSWSLSKKIWAILALLTVSFVGNVYLSLSRMNTLRDDVQEITGILMKRDHLASEVQDNQRRLTIATRDLALASNEEKVNLYRKGFQEILAKQRKDMDEYKEIASPQGKELIAKYAEGLDRWLKEAEKFMRQKAEHNDKEGVDTLYGAQPTLEEMKKHIASINELTVRILDQKSKDSNDMASRALTLCLIMAICSITLSLGTAFSVLRKVTSAINEVVRNLFDSSAQVSSAASQIASSSEELSQSTSEQAASLEQTAASIEEMNSMVAKNSENANRTASTSTKSQDKATEGKAVVEKMIHSMGEINGSNNTIMEQVNHGNDRIAEIVKVIEEIGSKTKVINDIVFQTKLLSFNASVEAARAGEHGKGFAVVAEEVGNLAQMSGNAAKEISQLLEASVLKVNQIVTETRSSVEKLITEGKETVESGTEVARHCGEMLQEIVTNVSSVSSMAGEIASASAEQSRGVTEITKAMNQLDQVTQQNAATSEECASAAEELSAQAEALRNAVSQLVLTIEGDKGDNKHDAPIAAVVEKPKKATAEKGGKVVHLKAPSHAKPRENLKKVVGEGIPDFQHEGFKEV